MKDSTPTQEKFFFNLQDAIEVAREMTLPNSQKVMLRYIEKYWKGGEITPINIPKNAAKAADIIRYCEHNQDSKDNITNQNRDPLSEQTRNGRTVIDSDKVLIGLGTLKKDVEWKDSDPYQTAGGYKRGVVREGTPVKIWLSYSYVGWKIEIDAEVNILVDHYNNNFFGNSTGNGTKEYSEGDRKESHSVAIGDTMHLISSFVENQSIDYDRIINFILNQGR